MNFTLNDTTLDLDINLVRGGLKIIECERADIDLAFAELRRNTAEELFQITFRDDMLVIKERTWKKASLPSAFFNNEANHDLVLELPKGTRLQGYVSTVSGDIRADNLNGKLQLKTISGQMCLGTVVSRRLKLQNIGGNLTIDSLEGAISARVVSGKCRIRSGNIRHFDISSVSGDITLSADLNLDRDSSIQTVSGDTLLRADRFDGKGSISISTLSGETLVEGEIPEEKVEIKTRMPFLKNHPFKSVMPAMKNFVSSFTRMATEDDIEVQAAEESDLADRHIEQILEMLSEGKISAEEAEKLINALK